MGIPIAIAEIIPPENNQYDAVLQNNDNPFYHKEFKTQRGTTDVTPSAPPESDRIHEEDTIIEDIYGKTISERLDELGRIKPYISTEKYFEKRSDILSCV